LYGRARRLHRDQKWQAVIDIFEQLRANEPTYPDEEGLLASAREGLEAQELAQRVAALYDEGQHHMDAEEWQQALERFEEVQRLEPGYRNSEMLLSRAQQQQHSERAEQREHGHVTNHSEQAAEQASQAEKPGLDRSLEGNEAIHAEQRAVGTHYSPWPWFIGATFMSSALYSMYRLPFHHNWVWLINIIMLGIATLFLAYLRPIDWRIAATLVTLLHVWNGTIWTVIEAFETAEGTHVSVDLSDPRTYSLLL
jgi:hypothetical protein